MFIEDWIDGEVKKASRSRSWCEDGKFDKVDGRILLGSFHLWSYSVSWQINQGQGRRTVGFECFGSQYLQSEECLLCFAGYSRYR